MGVSESLWVWGETAIEPKILHSMIRVADLERALGFYCDALGMRQLARYDVEAGRFSIIFISFSADWNGGALELTYNWDAPENERGYDHANGYGHLAIGVPDVPGTCRTLRDLGFSVTVEPKILFEGGPSLAFVKDPDGYNIELIQTSKKFAGI